MNEFSADLSAEATRQCGEGGETGIRTQATLTRRQISNLLRYHSGTSPVLSKIGGPKACQKPGWPACRNNPPGEIIKAGANVVLHMK